MSKKVFYDDDARRRILAGAELLYSAVKTTMGPKGRNVVIGKPYGGPPQVTHDGVTVAKAVELTDTETTEGYTVGAELVKSASVKMNDLAGDGTTTVTVLTYHILNEANKLIAVGHNPMQLRKGLETAGYAALEALQEMSEDISQDSSRVAEVATISAGDSEIGELVAKVMKAVGNDGVVTVEAGQGTQLDSEVVEGYTFERGYVSPYMVTDTNRMEAAYNKPAILITDKKLSSIQELLPLLEKMAQAGKKELVVIAEDMDGDALGSLILNKIKGVFSTVAIKAPSYGEQRKDILNDIATLVGAEVVSEEKGMNFAEVELTALGSARRVLVNKDTTTIIEGAGHAETIAERIAQLNDHIEHASSEYQKENLQKRRASLSGKVAVIKVGGISETEINEKKDRVDDAVCAAKAALAEGIVAGGGVTLLNIADRLARLPEVDPGCQLLCSALRKPFQILCENAGIVPEEWLHQMRGKEGMGINVNNPDKIVDLKKAGVVDPALVTKEAIQNAVSIAGTGMTMGALVVEEQKNDQSQNNGMGAM
jgi:chaperonin GroEL